MRVVCEMAQVNKGGEFDYDDGRNNRYYYYLNIIKLINRGEVFYNNIIEASDLQITTLKGGSISTVEGS